MKTRKIGMKRGWSRGLSMQTQRETKRERQEERKESEREREIWSEEKERRGLSNITSKLTTLLNLFHTREPLPAVRAN